MCLNLSLRSNESDETEVMMMMAGWQPSIRKSLQYSLDFFCCLFTLSLLHTFLETTCRFALRESSQLTFIL